MSRLHICHRCDNPPCCNPAHLFSGTPQDNMRDAKQKGRTSEGERHTSSKLTQSQVDTIRDRVAAGESVTALARDYGMGLVTIWHLVHGNSWKRSMTTQAPAIRHPLTTEQVRAIREASQQGESSRSIARRMGIGKSTVGSVLRGERHADVL